MLFNSYEFLFLFLPAFLLVYYAAPPRHRQLVLTAANYLFYAGWKTPDGWRPDGLLVLFGSTTVNYFLGIAIHAENRPERKKFLCGLSVAATLAILAWFKYAGFFERTLNAVTGREHTALGGIVLPVGISFFLFQCISYTVDIYRGRVRPTRNFLDFACYVSLFPHLIAGPILRYSFMENQLVRREHSMSRFAEGVAFFTIGLGKKVLLADTLGVAADQLFSGGAGGAYACWVGLIAYSLQIFYDFSGYSDMAVGLGRFIGFNIPQNFNSPYLSDSFAEFWRRWHMSLSFWLRDFLYIPLGGSRGSAARTWFNLFATMLLGGLWHGAAWTFVIWGAWHGALLAIERALGPRNPIQKLPPALRILVTNFFVMIGWAFFRAESWPLACNIIAGLFGLSKHGAATPWMSSPMFLLTLLACVALIIKGRENVYGVKWRFAPANTIALAALFIVCCILAMARSYSPFLYFQF